MVIQVRSFNAECFLFESRVGALGNIYIHGLLFVLFSSVFIERFNLNEESSNLQDWYCGMNEFTLCSNTYH